MKTIFEMCGRSWRRQEKGGAARVQRPAQHSSAGLRQLPRQLLPTPASAAAARPTPRPRHLLPAQNVLMLQIQKQGVVC